MPRGGAIAIATANSRFDAAYTLSHPAVAPGEYACLVVSAHGPGMSARHLNALGGPSSTPHEQQTGFILGPAAINDIVQQGGGHACVELPANSGINVRICFPP